MKPTSPLVITISRQMGSGGAYIGKKLAKKLKMHYADREIIRKAAEQFAVSEEEVESMDEKPQTWWDYIQLSSRYANDIYVPPIQKFAPTDLELYKVESEIIKKIAKECSAVIIGRCGFSILKGHPNLVNVLLYGDVDFRVRRVMDLYSVSVKSAEKMIAESDKKRATYIKKFSKAEWTDATQFNLCIDTSKTGIDKALDIILEFVKTGK